MYTQQDLDELLAQRKRRWLMLAIPEIAMLAGVVVSLVVRIEWLTTLLTCLMGALLIFCYDLLLKPLRCYEKHLRGVLEGRTRTLEGTFKRMETEDSLVEGVNYRGMIVSAGDPKDEEDDRLFYYDLQKPLPQLTEGERVRVVYHDREIASLEVMA